jgi:hypothetical protein
MRLEVLEEPDLIFGSGKQSIDQKLGLIQHGPCGLSQGRNDPPRVVRAGVVATIPTLANLRQFLQILRQRISPEGESRKKPWLVEFPGLGGKSLLKFDIRIDEDKVETIWPEEEARALATTNRLEKIENTVKLYEKKVSTLLEVSGVHHPEVLLLPISHETMSQCKDPNLAQEKIIYHRRTMAKRKRQVPTDFPLLDFHNVLKVIGMEHNLPVQVIRPSTLSLRGSGLQDPATIAWNISVAALYKGTGSPWKLADLDMNTCYVGIAFYVEVGEESNLRAAMAQVYLRTGESQVIRGKPFKWTDTRHRDPTLTEEQAHDILEDVVELYRDQWHRDPSRVVVHKRSAFRPTEITGFTSAVDKTAKLDLVHVYHTSSTRLYHLDRECGYPPMRGTLLTKDGTPDGVLYTSGFVKALGTYPGPAVPWPLRFSCDKLSSDPRTIATDIMSLTKLDWNSTDFSTSEPVTLSVAEKVGEILSETRARGIRNPPQGYRFYM